MESPWDFRAAGERATQGRKKLHLENVTKSFGGRKVVDVGDLSLGRHGIEGLIGPNGAGKTTLMNVITRKLAADSGSVTYYPDSEVDISRKRTAEIARLGVVKSNQIIQDFDSFTVRESMLLAVGRRKYERFYKILSDRALRREGEKEIARYINYFQFEAPDGYALSAGEKKLLDIVRCLLLKPSLLLLDEPTAGLPDDQTKKVMDLLTLKTVEEDLSVLVVEHDLALIWEVCEFVHFMSDGEILVQGSPEELQDNEIVAEKYLGTSHD